MSGRSLVETLRRADHALAVERLPPAAVRRIGRRIERELAESEGGARMPRWVPMATFVGGALLVLLVVTFGSPRRAAPEREPVATVVRGPHCERTGDDQMRLSGRCDVKVGEPAMTIRTADAAIELHGRTVDVQDGRASFDVDPIHDAPVRVDVPGGVIVVVGTRFDVVVDAKAQRGHVMLHEGSLRFEHEDGRASSIVAGERFAFGRRVVARAASVAQEPVASAAPIASSGAAAERRHGSISPRRRGRRSAPERPAPEPAAPEIDVDDVIAAVAASRRAGKFLAAATTLRDALERPLDEHAREVLSFELGTILSRHLHAPADACAHWAEHRRRFGDGRYAKQVARAEAELGCKPDE